MNVRIYLFEDQRQTNFYPLTLTRPLWDLRVGVLTIGEKWMLEFPEALVEGEVRPELDGVFHTEVTFTLKGVRDRKDTAPISYSDREKLPTIYINSRYLPVDTLVGELNNWLKHPGAMTEFIHQEGEKTTLVAKGYPAGVAPEGSQAVRPYADTSNESAETQQVYVNTLVWVDQPWELLDVNGPEIQRDIDRISASEGSVYKAEKASQQGVHPNAFIEENAKLYIHPEATVEPGVTILNAEGPVFIGAGATIMAGSQLRGPLAIGDKVVVKMGTLLYKNSSIGPHSKVGGEVSNCIFHSYSNKAHHGYAGNSIFGQWVNLGAGTTTSNLRGNYGEVRVTDWTTRNEIATGRQFLGSIMADHVKTGINSILNTGTVIGPSCMIFGAGFAPKWIDSFTWMDSDKGESAIYEVEKSLLDMQKMMARRDISMNDAYAALMRRLSVKK